MNKPKIYLDAVATEEYTSLVDKNMLPLVIVANDNAIAKLDAKYKKQLDVQYVRNADGSMYFLRVNFVDKVGELEDWGNLVKPDGSEEVINEFASYKHNKKMAVAISTDDNYYKCVDVLADLKDKVSSLKHEITLKRNN